MIFRAYDRDRSEEKPPTTRGPLTHHQVVRSTGPEPPRRGVAGKKTGGGGAEMGDRAAVRRAKRKAYASASRPILYYNQLGVAWVGCV